MELKTLADWQIKENPLWDAYARLTPQADAIHRLLESRGEKLVNDHIAFRTFNRSPWDLEAFESLFAGWGFERKGDYAFPEKHLEAAHFEHTNAALPKLFVSQILLGELSAGNQGRIELLLKQAADRHGLSRDLLTAGRLWKIQREDYESLADESEYAGWLAAFGFCPNHFTVSVNHLKSFTSLGQLNLFLKQEGISLNASGGEIKGSPEQLLEQSSTLAARIPCRFEDGIMEIPSCYYEFARRYPLPDGKLFQGFIAGSAKHIFESTDRTPGTQ